MMLRTASPVPYRSYPSYTNSSLRLICPMAQPKARSCGYYNGARSWVGRDGSRNILLRRGRLGSGVTMRRNYRLWESKAISSRAGQGLSEAEESSRSEPDLPEKIIEGVLPKGEEQGEIKNVEKGLENVLDPELRSSDIDIGDGHKEMDEYELRALDGEEDDLLEDIEDIEEEAIPVVTDDSPEGIARAAKNRFGDSLPKDFLSEEEYAVYVRLYGPPLRVTSEEELLENVEEEDVSPERNMLLREAEDGILEEVEYEIVKDGQESDDISETMTAEEDVQLTDLHEQVKLRNEQRAWETKEDAEADEEPIGDNADRQQAIEDIHDYWPGDEFVRTHPLTAAGRYGTSPSTLVLPKSTFTTPIQEVITNVSTKHITDVAERSFGGVGLPYSPSTPKISKTMEQKPIALTATQGRMSEREADVFITAVMPQVYASMMGVLVEVRKRLGSAWLKELLEKEGGPLIFDAGAGGAGVIACREILQAEWEIMQETTSESPETTSELTPAPVGKATVLTGSDSLRHRSSKLLDNTTFLPRMPDRVTPDQQNRPQPRKQYDIIIAPHMLWPIKEDYNRKHLVETFWSLLNPKGGILIILEKGVPRGFEVVAGARQLLLKKHISSPGSEHFETPIEIDTSTPENPTTERYTPKETACIIAPCTNHLPCPLYRVHGMSRGRKDWCYFGQRYTRPQFLQQILGAKSKNFDDVDFSYLVVQRGRDQRKPEHDSLFGKGFVQGIGATDKAFEGYGPPREEHIKESATIDQQDQSSAKESSNLETEDTKSQPAKPQPHPLSLPRTLLTPLKRKGHILIDVCTPSGTLERWMVSRNRPGKQAYRDARKAQWGDLWALGAKSRTERRVRLGRSIEEAKVVAKGKGKWKHKGGKGGKGKKPYREVGEEEEEGE